MKNLNKNKEWGFIKQEIVFNKPKRSPYKGEDLFKRELLLGLKELLCNYMHEQNRKTKQIRKNIYEMTKSFYLSY